MHSKTFTSKLTPMSDFLEAEGDHSLLLRLEALCEDKCDDLALKLAAAYVKHMNVSNVFNKFDVDQINDIVLVLLYRYEKTQEIIEKVKSMRLEDGLELLQRFDDHCKSEKRIWRYSDKVTEIASHTILASAMVKALESEEDEKLLFNLISQWAYIHIPKFIQLDSMTPIENMVRKIINTAGSSLHVYSFVKVLRDQFGDAVKTLCVELYIRALTANRNEIEQQKITNDLIKIEEAENLLADGFVQLGELFKSNKYVCRECLLTAFSVKPSVECFEKLNMIGNEFTCGGTSSANSKTTIAEGSYLDFELIGVEPHLADDLSTVLSGPRCQLLSWSMGWELLRKECQKYMAEYNSSIYKNKELKYIKLDYSQFQEKPAENLLPKIEKGYEKLEDVPKVKRKRKKPVNPKTPTKFRDTGVSTDDLLFQPSLSTDNDSDCSYYFSKDRSQLYNKNLRTYSNVSNSGLSEYKCTTPVTKTDDQGKLKQPCNVYSKSASPIPAEVPPVALSEGLIKSKIVPILHSLNLNPKVILTDILSGKNQRIKETCLKGDKPYNENLDILAQAVMRSDILLAKSVPGMNSLDMIVPRPQETTVQVVQISSSTSSLLTQSVSNSGVSQSLPPNAAHSRKTSDNSTETRTHSQNTEQNSENRQLLFSVQSSQSISTSHASVSTTTTPDLNASSSQMLHSNLNRVQNLKPNLGTQTTDHLNEIRNIETVELVQGSLSHQDTGTHVTSHIQSIGQPHKMKLQTEANCSSKNATNTSQHCVDDGHKSQTNPVYRLVVKDGRVIEQYFQANQSLDPVISIPDTAGPDNSTVSAQTFNQNQFIKLLNRKKDFKTKEELLAHKVIENELLPPSLPKFHHVFGRQKYQSGPSIPVENSNVMSSQTQFEDSPNNKQEVRSTTPLSKGVQTVIKDPETPKINEKMRSDASSQVAVPSTSSDSSCSSDKDNRVAAEVQPSSGVIFTCKVPISIANTSLLQGKPVTILKATSTADVIIPNAKMETEIRNKDSVIRSNMNALLAAALQSSPPMKHTVINNNPNASNPSNVKHIKIETPKTDVMNMSKVRMPTPAPKTFRRQPLVQQGPSRFVRPLLQVSTGNSMTQTGPPVVTIPLPARTVVLATNINQNSLPNLSKMETRREINTDQSVSSTTLEQLREFESVLEQVTNTSQMKERGNVNKKNEQTLTHQTETTDFSQNTSKVNTMFQSSIVSTISDLNSDRVSLTFISKSSPAITSNSTVTLAATSNAQKITTNTPVVVVQSCSRPLASPALSIASQSSSSPAPQTPPANAQSKIPAKINKPKAKSSIGKTAPTTTLKVSTLPKPQQKPQEDEQTTQRIYAILDKYAEQLRNSPELKNKPAPRRRSNPPTNPTQSSKRKKSSQSKSKSISSLPSCSGLEMSPGSEDLRTLGSEDSSNGVSQISQLPNSPQSKNDDLSNPPGGDVSSEASESLDAKDQRSQHRLLLTEPSPNTSRTVLVQENLQPMINVEGTKVLTGKQLVVGSGATVPLTLSLPVAGNVKQVIFPVPADGRFVVAKGPKMYRVHQVTMPSGSPLLATTGSGAVVLRQMCLNKSNSTVKQVKLPVVSQIPSQNLTNLSQPTVVLPSGSQSFTLSTGSGIEAESLGIALDNTILLNTTTASSLSFFQRNVKATQQSVSSPSVFTTSKPQDHVSTLSTNTESVSSLQTNLELKKRVNISSQCDDFKPKTEEVQFSLSEEAEKLASSTNFISTTPKNWTQMLKDVKDEIILDSQGNKKLVSDSQVKKEFSVEKDCEIRDLLPSKDVKNVKVIHNEIIVKQKKDEGTSFRDDTQTSKIQALPNHGSSSQWQFNVAKMEKGIVKEVKTMSPNIQDSKTPTILQSTGQLGLKRKLNVENTIFQVAFKRSDRLKVSKDEFLQQRNSALALEREIRLQKSLSEECEDLGVDKPSTSDLFPEAELLLDSDPLSRDSLQELYTRGMESSSSSHESPNRCSSPMLLDMVSNKYSWRKQKKETVRRGQANASRDVIINKESQLDHKSDSSNDDSPMNGASGETKKINSAIFKPISNKNDEKILNQHAIPNISLEPHDSDNFSESEPNDIIGDSDNEMHNSCKESEIPKLENDKTDQASESSPNMLSNCTYTYENYMQKSKSHDETNLSWFHLVKSQDEKDMEEEEIRKSNISRSSIVWQTPESIVEEIRASESPKEITKDSDCGHSALRNSKQGKEEVSRVRKRKRGFVSSGEDSGSSLDAEEGLEIDRLARRTQPRRNKKGCPCFNGNQDSKKKKETLGSGSNKTDKACSAPKPLTYHHTISTKKPSKPAVKSVNKKR